MRPRPGCVLVAMLAIATAGCATQVPPPAGGPGVVSPPSGPTTTAVPAPPGLAVPAAPPSGPAVSGVAPLPGFVGETSAVTADDLGQSWRPGCPVGPDQLRLLRLSYWGFDARPHVGTMVVHHTAAPDVVKVFAALYRARFPIRRMEPVDRYAGSDDRSMAADNTSGFNCREVVSTGPAKWSAHAYGQAIDVNPVENPYLVSGRVLPPAGATYTGRSDNRAGMAVPGGVLVATFTAMGWTWGGVWRSPDYQHFSRTGG